MMQQDLQLPEQRPLWEQVHDVLEDLIIHRKIEPGAHLVEQELSEKLGVSRGPVRDALRILHQAGWVDMRHRQGAYIRIPNPEEALEVFEVRESLESKAAELASQRISDAELSELRDLIEKGYDAVDANNSQTVVDLNRQFHRVVAAAAGNSLLQNMLERVEKQVTWYLAAVLVYRGNDSWDEHRALVGALQNKDAEEAASIMVGHTRATAKSYAENVGYQESTEKTIAE